MLLKICKSLSCSLSFFFYNSKKVLATYFTMYRVLQYLKGCFCTLSREFSPVVYYTGHKQMSHTCTTQVKKKKNNFLFHACQHAPKGPRPLCTVKAGRQCSSEHSKKDYSLMTVHLPRSAVWSFGSILDCQNLVLGLIPRQMSEVWFSLHLFA